MSKTTEEIISAFDNNFIKAVQSQQTPVPKGSDKDDEIGRYVQLDELITNYFKVRPVEDFGLDTTDLAQHLYAALAAQAALKK